MRSGNPDLTKKTAKNYGVLWSKVNGRAPEKYHFDRLREAVGEQIVRGKTGIEIGCGCGWDLFRIATQNPSVRIVGMDISPGIQAAAKLTGHLANAAPIQGSAGDIPFKDRSFDFVYSFGVLHHLPDFRKGLSEVSRILKKECPCFLYLYEDHSDNPIKHYALRIVSLIRKFSTRINPKLLYTISCLASPVCVILFSYPARLLKMFRYAYPLYSKIPFNFGTNLFSLRGDIYDRFSAPIENRFSREGLSQIMLGCGFGEIRIFKLKDTAGWIVRAISK